MHSLLTPPLLATILTAVTLPMSVVGITPTLAQNAYVTNSDSNTVSVLDSSSNMVATTIPVGFRPEGVAIAPDGRTVYITNFTSNAKGRQPTTSSSAVVHHSKITVAGGGL